VMLLRYVMLSFAKLPIFASLAVVGATHSYLLSQPRTVSLCIVDTKPDRAGPYEPPAGPFAIGMYQQLAGRRLKDGSALHLIVFPASLQADIIVPEVQRLKCSWVLPVLPPVGRGQRHQRYAVRPAALHPLAWRITESH
jgi:hypothetical protein